MWYDHMIIFGIKISVAIFIPTAYEKQLLALLTLCYMQPGEADMKNIKWHQIFKINNCPVERLGLL